MSPERDDYSGLGWNGQNDLMNQADLVYAYLQELKSARREDERRKARQAIEEKVARGEATFKAARGYRNVRKAGHTWVEFDPSCAFQVEETFKLAETGKFSVNRLCIEMGKKGLVGKDGKRLTQASMWKMLTNPFYCGYVRRHGGLFPGKHPCLISKELFDAVQNQLHGTG